MQIHDLIIPFSEMDYVQQMALISRVRESRKTPKQTAISRTRKAGVKKESIKKKLSDDDLVDAISALSPSELAELTKLLMEDDSI